jgi:clan AA aspartic protease (TIGR02281 family)
MAHMKKTARTSLFAFLALYALLSSADPCAPEQYFAPEDARRQAPLSAPHQDFRSVHAFAVHGIAKQQRVLATFYETGYLVSACRERAAYWYGEAAQRGDEVARAWVERQAAMERPRNRRDDGARETVLQMGPAGSYMAMVAINGKTVRGIVDTGASTVALSAGTADELGISYINGRPIQMRTVNGTIKGRAIVLRSISVGGITLENVEAVVSEGDHPLLVGMSFLKRLGITTSGNAMTLTKP